MFEFKKKIHHRVAELRGNAKNTTYKIHDVTTHVNFTTIAMTRKVVFRDEIFEKK